MSKFFSKFFGSVPREEKGFTLFELLVVIVMIAILSGLIFVNPDNWQRSLALERSAQKFSQDISQSRSLSMKGAYETGDCSGSNIDGYGVYFNISEPSKYFIYRNCDLDLSNKDRSYDSAEDEKFEGVDINLENNIIFCGATKNGVDAPSLSIFFDPPDPTVVIDETERATSSITVCIDGDASKQKTIEINSAGNINLR